jgi:tRNA(fMet)-specific endonuclease VapC
MIALDTDIMTLALHGDASIRQRLDVIPLADQGVPIVVLDELLRGRLLVIRQAEAGKGTITLPEAYDLLIKTATDAKKHTLLPFTPAADQLVKSWKRTKIKVGMKDLRIAAIAIIQGAKLVTRNARDYAQVPGLNFEVWS